MAVEFANLGYVALAADLYGKPPVTDPQQARAMMEQMDPEAATDLDQLTARNSNVAIGCQGSEYEHDRRRAVVDHDC